MTTSKPGNATPFIAGGEMGERIRALDWSTTPLGPVESWPTSLRTATEMMLRSKMQIVFFCGPEFVVLYNDAYRPVFGAKHPWALGLPGRIAWSELWEPMLHALLQGVVDSGETFQARDLLFLVKRHGFEEETYFDICYDPVVDEAGAVVGVYCIVTETTGRVVGERRLAMLRDLATHTADTRTAKDACIRSMQVLGSNTNDVLFASVWIDDVAQASSGYDTATDAGEEPRTVLEFPLDTGTNNRASRLVVGINPKRPVDDQLRSFLDLVANQIGTSIKNAEAYEAERQRAESLAEIDRAKTSFFTGVSHEFRTPLTLMLGPLEDLRARATNEEDLALLDTAERNAERLLRLVNSLLEVASIEGGHIGANAELLDLGSLTANLASTFRSACERAGLSLNVSIEQLPFLVSVDRAQWETIILNLLSNAFKFTFEGGIDVSVRPSPDSESAEVIVHDTGVGIDAAQLPKVFNRFHRVEGARSRSIEGSGIGLALTNELVKLNGGIIAVESVVGVGTTFTLRVPYSSEPVPANSRRPDGSDHVAISSRRITPIVNEALRWIQEPSAGGVEATESRVVENRARILIADDNADMRQYLARIFAGMYDVQLASTGDEALELALASQPDLVLSDVMMPGIDGLTLASKLREDQSTRTTPLILLSARAGDESRGEGLAAGADDYITKPFSARDLLARVAAQLGLAELRRKTEQELRSSEEKYRNLFNSIDEGFCILDVVSDKNGVPVDLYFVEINEAFERQTGMPNPLGKFTSEVVPGLEKAWVDVYSRVAATGVTVRFEEEAKPLKRWFDVYASRVGGPGSVRVAVVFRDVTARKDRESRTDLLDCITEDLMRLSTPRAIMETVGKRVSDALGLSSFTFVDVDEVRDEVDIEFGWVGNDVELLHTTFSLSEYLTDEFRRAAHAGELFVVSDASNDARTSAQAYEKLGIGAFVTVPFHWEGRWSAYMSATTVAPRGWTDEEVALLKEISTRLFASVERARVGEALDEANRRKDEFLATLAHELRNPLAPIRNGVEVLRMSGPPSQAPIVDVIDRQATHLVRLVDDLMEVSRITRGKIELRREIIDLKQVLRAAIETAGPVLDASGTTFSLSLPNDRVLVDADAVRLGQIFTNLLNNAAKYTDAGGHISLSLECKASQAVVCVRDSGTGIPPEMLPRVFDLFTQVDRTLGRAQGGLGIGLALVKSLVELHDGRVEVRSEGPGKGSDFVVRLPLANVDHPVTKLAEGDGVSANRRPLAGRRVLVIDDNRDAANTMSLLLQHMGATVRTEYSGAAALNVIPAYQPEVAFVDIGMPGMDGYTVAERVRSDSANANVRLVALTGWGQEQDVRRAREAGFDHHLVKPANADRVVALFASAGS